MDKFIFTVLFLLFNQVLIAQEPVNFQSETIPFSEVEQPPLAKSCKSKWELKRQKDCTSSFVNNFVNYRFNMDLAKKLGVKGSLEMEASFIVTKAGKVDKISVKGGPEGLNEHVINIINKLPNFKPARHQDESVAVSFHLPISMYLVP